MTTCTNLGRVESEPDQNIRQLVFRETETWLFEGKRPHLVAALRVKQLTANAPEETEIEAE